jgi:glycosyltransferase involved in cell wall biosynthesis
VIHAHSSKAGALARALKPALPCTPVVYSPHGYAFAGHFESERQRTAYRLIEACLSPLTSRTLCVCEFERALARQVGPARRTRAVHNGVEPPADAVRPDPRVAALAERGPVVGALSLLRPGKGVETLVDAAPRILERHPQATIAVAGDGALQADLERRIAGAGVHGQVVLLGRLPDAGALLSGTTVAVNPSWAESFPYAVLESMAAGVPMVSTRVGGIAEALDDGRTGLLVPARDPRALADAVSALLDDPDRARRMGGAAREHAAQRFTLDLMADGAAAVYAELGA